VLYRLLQEKCEIVSQDQQSYTMQSNLWRNAGPGAIHWQEIMLKSDKNM